MSEPTLETLDFSKLNIHTSAAARLLSTECIDLSPVVIEWDTESSEQNVERFIEQYSNPACTTYALVQDRSGVIAASSVVHGLGDLTSILHLAVHPETRREGHGTRLIRHIAEQAIEHGDINLGYNTNHEYFTRPDEKGFLDFLGFQTDFEVDFEVSVSELLTRTE